MLDITNTLLAILIVILSVWIVFKFISFLAVSLRARSIKNLKVPLSPRYQKMLNDKDVLVLYFYSPLTEKGRNRMGNVMKIVDEEFGNVIKINMVNDRKEAEKFNVISAPTIVIIDKEGIVREYKTGFIPYPKVKSMIERIANRIVSKN
ncbi:MAG: thioredoxin family protein [Spirochaetia bacterium]|nr:thioredoxin family protein [Spirochaetota bacterium]MCX8096249.1 thioredoxin family protein [Spirochaetota bacterium]MDW8112899.1 thioredoxin family protein [Spirochaetia bacterium]